LRLQPFPFSDSPATFELVRRVLGKRDWSEHEFRRVFFGCEPQRVHIVVER
jgi:hypothetical protein